MAKASGTRARYYSIASMPPRIAAPLHSSLSSNFVQNNDRHGYHVGSVWLERLTLSADARTVCKGVDPNHITRTIQVHVYFVSAKTSINHLASMTRSFSELFASQNNMHYEPPILMTCTLREVSMANNPPSPRVRHKNTTLTLREDWSMRAGQKRILNGPIAKKWRNGPSSAIHYHLLRDFLRFRPT